MRKDTIFEYQSFRDIDKIRWENCPSHSEVRFNVLSIRGSTFRRSAERE